MEAAVSASEGSLGAVLEKLQLLAAECSRIAGVGKQIGFLQSELAAMHALLRKVAAMEDEGPVDVQVKAWAREVREMAYDIEDCIDAFARQQRPASAAAGAQGGGVREFFARCGRFLTALRSRRQFADQIDALKDRVVEVAERRERYWIDQLADRGDSTGPGVDPRLAALFADGDHLVGIDGPRDELARWLLEVGEDGGKATDLKVLSIVGFGGLGKTTLANQVYLKIRGDFDCKAFVSVSQKPNLKQILRDCLFQLVQASDMGEWDEKKIISEMREYLADKRYLIVIDDVWSTSVWDSIRCAFPGNTCCSRIIMTTRINDVACSCSSVDGQIYQMEPLNYVYSKRLFVKRIFGSEEFPLQFQEVLDEILKKCGGLPLAIISISGLLANKPIVKEEWEKVRNSIGSALERDRNLEGIKAILTLSYNDLPHHLKTCLLYLSIFPEDCNIERGRLINRWIAEGFIPHERGLSTQDVAENYFFELINKSMVEPVGIGYDGKAYAVRVHDIMLELIISKATQENFITIVGSQESIGYPKCNIRRLSIQQADQLVASVLEGKDVSHARSLTTFGPVMYLPHIVEFEVLRVLDLEECAGLEEYDLNSIGKLIQLRYLSLRGTWISNIPSEIVKLHDLETLDLRETEIEELPVGIVHLTKLQNLLISKYVEGLVKLPNGIGNIRNLVVLSGFNISLSSVAAVEDLSKLTNLKEIHIQLDTKGYDKIGAHEEVLLSSLNKLGRCKLQSLWIRSGNSSPMEFIDSWSPLPFSLQRFRMTTNYYFSRTPKWIARALTSLAYLNINLVEVKEEDLHILGELPALLSLKLSFKTGLKQRLTVGCSGFRCLKQFHFIPNHRNFSCEGYLVFESGAFPKLEKLKLPFSVSMAKGDGFYLGIQHLPRLRHAVVTLGKKGATSSESKAAASAIKNEANTHPNHPQLIIRGERAEEDQVREQSDADEDENNITKTGLPVQEE